ncbi:cobyric acid synthase [Desulfopila sp. IMCC35006]|uniref:cobyric acid synthase n=1 Tax=Desulfopila sp. IMCC35006 TaxID=2569542 RepID=UPI0010AC25B1|nr:cobyric acid synthase [Desulfopila sp. IMCC35006]TKB27409.1 cobyric acid synthase [Desulfopila sp. IMCC35006]
MNTFEHGGNIHKTLREAADKDGQILDFSANINPLGPPEWFRPLISSQLEKLIHYPDPENTSFIEAIAEHTKISKEHIVVGNGTTELLYAFMRVLPCKRVVIPVPSYVDYARAAAIAGWPVALCTIREEDDFTLDLSTLSAMIQPEDLVIIATPNNPTGKSVDRAELLSLIKDFPDSYFLIDEAFLDFIEASRSLGAEAANILTLNSMTKFYGVPGLRIGYGVVSPSLALQVKENLPPWTVNSLAQAVGTAAVRDNAYQVKTRQICRDLRRELERALRNITQLKVYDAEANYLFVKVVSGGDAGAVADFCLEHGIMIRRCENYQGLASSHLFFRVAVRTAKENQRLVAVLHDFFARDGIKKTPRRKARSIMFQGTCSDAGKSIMTAALCRILYQDGVRVAPFKAQNMSLNSFVTLQGDEMGRAQVVQAQAARLDPDCRMNPILLKPNSDTGSQIIVCGKPVGNMSVLDYNSYKPKVWGSVCKSYDALAEEFDVVVLEGAGSPGEVNLKADDIVNMRMAQYAEAPVILVGDIDRGGVYASFVGIMEVLAEWERQLVAGFLVNKFRGQASLLEAAHDYVKMHTGRSVFGVVPYLKNLGLPEEDSVSFKKGSFNKQHAGDGIEIVVINLPHISNFTDVEPFLEEPDVTLRIVDNAADIGSPQAIILPGSKNVIHDLRFLKDGGFAEKIGRCLEKGCEIIGICGGYQMLGTLIHDPYEIESVDGQLSGLGYLAMETVIERDKNLTRKSGTHQLSGKKIFGYEIHHGISSISGRPVLHFDDGTSCGQMEHSGKIWGCYLHGIFDSDEFRRWFIDNLRQRAGLQPAGEILAPYNLEIGFDRLAACVRENVDMDALYRLLKI